MQTLDKDGNLISKSEVQDGENTDQGQNNGDNNGQNNGDSNGGQNNGGSTTDPNTGGDTGTDGGTDQPSSALFETPYLLLQEYSTGSGQVAAGSEFNLSFTCRNTSQQIDLENIIVKVAPGEGLQVVDSTNVFYLPIVNKNDTFDKEVRIAALTNAEAGSTRSISPLPMSM